MIDQSRAECSAAKGGDDYAVAARDENTQRVAQVLFRHVRVMTKREARTGHVHGTSGCSVPSASTMVPKASGVHQGAPSAWTRWTERRIPSEICLPSARFSVRVSIDGPDFADNF